MSETASLLAGAFVAGVRDEGLEPDPALRLLQHVGSRRVGPVAGPGDLGPLHERSLSRSDRAVRGAWYTPAWFAEALAARALPDREAMARGTVLDPSCGGGAFLLATVRRMCALGADPAAAVDGVRGRDVDPVAVAVSEAALWWWSARLGSPVVAGDRLRVDDGLTGRDWGAHGAVVGNPPFLGQLRSATAVDPQRRAALRDRFGAVVRAYTDPAWLFMVAAVEAVAPGGRIVMVQPQSLLAARDAMAVRAFVDERAELVDTVIDDGCAFGPSVAVCAPVLQRRSARPATSTNDWVAALADARGVPAVEIPVRAVLGDIADVHAGFRDEYYGLVGAVQDHGTGPRLVTAGAIDPFRVLDRPQRFAGRRWEDPRVERALVRGRAARWLTVQQAPKVLVATQTRVLEAVADPRGALVGSVPVLCVRPHDPAMLWHVLAAVQTPAVSAWLLRRSAGTALSTDACRPTTALLAQLPLPTHARCWDEAAAAARELSRGTGCLDAGAVDGFAASADAAYGLHDEELGRWWRSRRPDR